MCEVEQDSSTVTGGYVEQPSILMSSDGFMCSALDREIVSF